MPNQKNYQKRNKLIVELPPIPDKLYFSIGEASRLCAVKPYVLRYWEQEFPAITPSKKRYNRRYYQKNDIILIRHIRSLLYEQGFTIDGARTQLAMENRKQHIEPGLGNQIHHINNNFKNLLQDALGDIDDLLGDIEATN